MNHIVSSAQVRSGQAYPHTTSRCSRPHPRPARRRPAQREQPLRVGRSADQSRIRDHGPQRRDGVRGHHRSGSPEACCQSPDCRGLDADACARAQGLRQLRVRRRGRNQPSDAGRRSHAPAKLRRHDAYALGRLRLPRAGQRVSRIHTLAINPASGFLYAQGSNTNNGGLHVIDVRDPASDLRLAASRSMATRTSRKSSPTPAPTRSTAAAKSPSTPTACSAKATVSRSSM